MTTLTASTDQLICLLDDLSSIARSKEDGEASSLVGAVGVIDELGELVIRGSASDIREAQAAVDALREQLELDGVFKSPVTALEGKTRQAYLAGALWAVNELMKARLTAERTHEEAAGRTTRRATVRDLVLSSLDERIPMSPTALLAELATRDPSLRKDEISRALGDLLLESLAETVESGPGTDRRNKYFVRSGHAVA